MQRDGAVFELVEGRIVILVDTDELLLKSLQLVLVLVFVLHHAIEFRLQLAQVSCATFNILLGFEKIDLLFLVVRLD